MEYSEYWTKHYVQRKIFGVLLISLSFIFLPIDLIWVLRKEMLQVVCSYFRQAWYAIFWNDTRGES